VIRQKRATPKSGRRRLKFQVPGLRFKVQSSRFKEVMQDAMLAALAMQDAG